MNRFGWIGLAAGVGLALGVGGCVPVVTGGDVQFDVYVADDPRATLLSESPMDELPGVLQKAHAAARAVVVPAYRPGVNWPPYMAAQVVTPGRNTVRYTPRVEMAYKLLTEKEFYPPGRPSLAAWVFTENGWPVFVKEGPRSHLITGYLWSKWGGYSPEVRPGLEGQAVVMAYPASRPWDQYSSAASGCREVRYLQKPDDVYETRIGDHGETTMAAMAEIPCWFIGALEASRSVTDEDRLMVYCQVLRLYELTKDYWEDKDPAVHGTTYRDARDQNTALLRQRIAALEGKAASAPAEATTKPGKGAAK